MDAHDMDNSRWQLTENSRNILRLSERAVCIPLMMPLNHLAVGRAAAVRLTELELVDFTLGVGDAMLQHIPGALCDFEQRLLPTAQRHGKRWQSCLLLWSALCRLYLCDPVAALRHLRAAEGIGPADALPEITLAKGMGLRLSGDHASAVEIMESLMQSRVLLPDEETMARAWVTETRLAGGLGGATAEDVEWLKRRNRNVYEGTLGILLGALYRIGLCARPAIAKLVDVDAVLGALDNVALFEQPMLTMLLQDILPRPLAGVEPTTEPPDAYWDESARTSRP